MSPPERPDGRTVLNTDRVAGTPHRLAMPATGAGGHCAHTRRTEIVRATGQIGSLTLLSRVVGLARDIVIGYVFGAGPVADAFFVAFRIPNFFRRLVGEGATAAAFVPVISGYLARRSAAETERMLRAFLGTGLGLLLLLTGLGMVSAEPLVELCAPGFAGEKRLLTTRLTRAMFVYLFFVGGLALATGVLHAFRHFAAPAFAPVLLNVTMILCVVGLSGRLAEPVMSLAYGVIAGGACQLLWQLPALLRRGVSLRFRWQPGHPALRQMGGLLLPLVFGTGIYQLNLVIGTQLASLSTDGSVSRLWYANRLFEFPIGIFVAALSTAILPGLARHAQQHDTVGLRDSLGFALRLVNVVMLPAAVGVAALAVPVMTVLFYRGAFSVDDVTATAAALQGLALGLWAISATRQLTVCLYAVGDTRTPVWGGLLSLVVNVAASLVLMGGVQPGPGADWLAVGMADASIRLAWQNFGIVGLALANSLAALANFVFQAVRVSRRVPGLAWRSWAVSLAWSMAASLGMFLVVRWVLGSLSIDAGSGARPAPLAGVILLGLLSYSIVVWPGAKHEIRVVLSVLPDALLRRLPQFLQPLR